MNGRFEQLDRQQHDGASTSGPSRLKRTFSSCFGCCVSKQDVDGDSHLQPLNMFEPRNQNTLEDLLERSTAARKDTWQELGTVEPLVLSDSANPALLGGPKWPALRQAFRVVRPRTGGNVILASDGLSDPFDDVTLGEGNVNGFGLEFFIETPSEEIADSVEEIKTSWQFQLLYTVSQLAAGHGSIKSILDDMKLLSTEAEGVNVAIPEADRPMLVNSAGRVGALLGLKSSEEGVPQKIETTPLTEVHLVNIKLLTLKELQLITEQGAVGRQKLDSLFEGSTRLMSSLSRPSTV